MCMTGRQGTATTKKVAKQLSAQSLLVQLHERTMKTYYAVAELYSSVTKGQPVISESFSAHGAQPTAAARMDSYRRPVDPRLNRSAPGDSTGIGGRGKKRDRRSVAGAYNGGGAASGYAEYSEDAVGDYVQAAAAAGYSQYGGTAQAQAQQWGGYTSYYNTGVPWQAAAREPEEVAYAASSAPEQHSDRERIVEYSQSAPPAHSGYGQYYGDGSWAGYNGGTAAPQYMPPMAQGYPGYGSVGQYSPPPPVHSDSSGSRYGHRPPAPGDRTAVFGRLKVRSWLSPVLRKNRGLTHSFHVVLTVFGFMLVM